MDEGTLLDLAVHEAALRFGSCLLRCGCSCSPVSALHNDHADPDEEGPGDEWMALEGLRVRSGHDVLVCVGSQEISEKTEVGACRRAVDLGRCTRANSVTRGNQRMRATRRTKEEHYYRSPEHVQFDGQRCRPHLRVDGQC